jgi:hypothetical protein
VGTSWPAEVAARRRARTLAVLAERVSVTRNDARPSSVTRYANLYCESFQRVPKRITLDIDDTFDAVHGGQQLRLFNAHYDEYGFQPIVVFDGEG